MNFRLLLLSVLGLFTIVSCNTVTIETSDQFNVVELPEGTIIYMNKNSELVYPKNFTQNRTVSLTGEAYFDVSKNGSPFNIKTEQGDILITGTKLNVNTNNDELEVEVDEGAIEVTANKIKHAVKRGERIVYNAVKNNFNKEKGQRKFEGWMSQLDRDLNKLGNKMEKGIKKGSDKAGEKLKKIIK
ncbi:MAG TPA: FecR family protein [Fulvivirga sp.]|nr:FecR family protein [Fulvivirga sp.]